MTYGTLTTLSRRPVALVLLDDRDTGWRGTEDAYAAGMRALARREGHVGAVPASPGGTPFSSGRTARDKARPTRERRAILATLGRLVDRPRHLRSALTSQGQKYIDQLIADGLVREIHEPTRWHPHRTVLVITAAGRARLEAL